MTFDPKLPWSTEQNAIRDRDGRLVGGTNLCTRELDEAEALAGFIVDAANRAAPEAIERAALYHEVEELGRATTAALLGVKWQGYAVHRDGDVWRASITMTEGGEAAIGTGRNAVVALRAALAAANRKGAA